MSELQSLPDAALDRLFREARTVHAFQPVPVDDKTLRALYDLLKWGPTAFKAQPARYVFVRSPEAKERLVPFVSAGNQAQTRQSAVTATFAPGPRLAFEDVAQIP